jgi:hypothetical protein
LSLLKQMVEAEIARRTEALEFATVQVIVDARPEDFGTPRETVGQHRIEPDEHPDVIAMAEKYPGRLIIVRRIFEPRPAAELDTMPPGDAPESRAIWGGELPVSRASAAATPGGDPSAPTAIEAARDRLARMRDGA